MKDLKKEMDWIEELKKVDTGEHLDRVFCLEEEISEEGIGNIVDFIKTLLQGERKKTLEEVKELLDLNPYTVKEEIDNLLSKLLKEENEN